MFSLARNTGQSVTYHGIESDIVVGDIAVKRDIASRQDIESMLVTLKERFISEVTENCEPA